jgi:hypothetical protein
MTGEHAPVAPRDAEAAGREVEALLDRLDEACGPDARAVGGELVRALMRFYGAGLARVLQLVAGPAGAGPREALLADSRVAGLLTLHDLHPEDLRTRIGRALASLPGAPFAVAELDETAGALRVRRAEAGGGCGCGSTRDTEREAVEAAIACFAPEIEHVAVDAAAPAPAPLLQIGVRPGQVAGAAR